jgi:hypothetical protein
LSYSQSKSEKYPKQTVINGDTVVILSLSQAIEMNQSFMEMQAKIDSINAVADTLQSVVIVNQSKNVSLQRKVDVATRQLDKKYSRQERLQVVGDVILGTSAFVVFFLIANQLNQY